jgi:hypothetical protein
MKNSGIKNIGLLLLSVFIIAGCSKNETTYFADAEDEGIAIFSNTGNNLLTCFIDGKPWRTISRTTSGFNPRTSYEVDIVKQITSSLQDTLSISWPGYFSTDSLNPGSLTLLLPVAKNFGYKDFSALQGRRLQIDTINGFFSTSISRLNTSNRKGSGSIYFHAARLDSIGPNAYTGNISGLFEADFATFKITKGRFDHTIVPQQVFFP